MDLDSLISKYSKDLMEMKSKWAKWGIETQEQPTDMKKDEDEPIDNNSLSTQAADLDGTKEVAIKANGEAKEEDLTGIKAENEKETTAENEGEGESENENENESETESQNENEDSEEDKTESEQAENETPSLDDSILPEGETEDFAEFSARVFTGEDAYPVEKAKILLYKDKKLYHFLLTDENGKTPKIKILAPPKDNSLIPNSENQQINYLADVFADGFTPKRGLIVCAVGGSDILLETQLIPIPERID